MATCLTNYIPSALYMGRSSAILQHWVDQTETHKLILIFTILALSWMCLLIGFHFLAVHSLMQLSVTLHHLEVSDWNGFLRQNALPCPASKTHFYFAFWFGFQINCLIFFLLPVLCRYWMPMAFAHINPSYNLLKRRVYPVNFLFGGVLLEFYCLSHYSVNSQILPVSNAFNFRIYKISLFIVTARLNFTITSLNNSTSSSLMSNFILGLVFIESL